LVFALLQGNFAAWRYPYPKAMQSIWLRLCTLGMLWLMPMRMELTTLNLVIRRQAIPAFRNGRLKFALGAPFFLVKRRLRMMLLIAKEAGMRLSGKRCVLKLL